MEFETWEPEELKRRLDAGEEIRLIDVREQQEWDRCKIEGAELKPLSQAQTWASEMAKETGTRVFFCHHGMRSAQVCMYLSQLGSKDVINLSGGIDSWAKTVDPSVGTY